MKMIVLLVASVLLVSGCTGYGPVTEAPAPPPSPTAPASPTPSPALPPSSTPTPVLPLSPTPASSTPTPSPPLPAATEFTITADDEHFGPGSITVPRGENITLIFVFNDADIYFGGLDITSEHFTIRYTKGSGMNKTVSFVPLQSFQFRSYWPSSGVLKAVGTVNMV